MSRQILVPYDGGEPADAALEFALREYPDAAVVVLHVVSPFPDHTAAGREGAYEEDWRERAGDLADETFERARAIAGDHGAEIDTEWRYGRPRHVILDYLEEQPVDQVVMGSHGRGAVSRLVFGSVAEAVVRRSPVPVTIVRERPSD